MNNIHLRHIDFRWVWSKVLPQVYDDSLSYYEQLCKLGQALDELATQCEDHFTEIYALIEIINDEIAKLKKRMDDAEANIADLIIKTGLLREDVDYLLSISPSIAHLEDVTAKLIGGNQGEVLTKATNTDYDYTWSIVRGVPAYDSTEEGKLLCVGVDGGNVALQWIDPPTDIPDYYATDDGKVLKIMLDGGEPVMYWGLGVPNIEVTDANKILAVNGTGDALEWKAQTHELPGYAYSDRKKSLCVNADGDGVEWAMREGELPSYSLDESFYVLSVNQYGNGIFWQNNKVLGVEAFEGAGLPSSNIKAKTGDIYRDTTNDKLYWCARYIDPDNITSLEYLGVVWNETLPVYTGLAYQESIEFDLDYTSNNLVFDKIGFYSGNVQADPRLTMSYRNSAQTGAMQVYQGQFGSNPWTQGTAYKTIPMFTGGDDIDNPDLINYITTNGTILNAGAQWVEVSPTVITTDYDAPLKAPSFRAKGDYTLESSGVAGQRINLYLTGATVGTYGRLFVENTNTHYVKKYEFMYLGNGNGLVVDNNITPAPATEDWYVETTPTSNGYLVVNCGSNSFYFKAVATFDYVPQ